ncbi:uncharacterized protein LOC119358347 [Triticum dicoccoides]|uniref:uncharacterized protein LOC119358347 n=1 Tax=Triticum dicoccoides TaxID=85692 RepID=UPI00189079F2|nr:uncharacterized protein LOC119358347 [Triticum dicoccoides]
MCYVNSAPSLQNRSFPVPPPVCGAAAAYRPHLVALLHISGQGAHFFGRPPHLLALLHISGQGTHFSGRPPHPPPHPLPVLQDCNMVLGGCGNVADGARADQFNGGSSTGQRQQHGGCPLDWEGDGTANRSGSCNHDASAIGSQSSWKGNILT